MNPFIKKTTLAVLLVTSFACSDTKKVIESEDTASESSVIAPAEKEIKNEIVHVNDFNKQQPFFSSLIKDHVEWETISQENEGDKLLQFRASTIFVINDMIIKSTVVDDDININHGIHTGMSRSEFEKHFDDLKAYTTPSEEHPIIKLSPNEVSFSCCTEDTQYWKFKFINDTLYEVDYYQYYD